MELSGTIELTTLSGDPNPRGAQCPAGIFGLSAGAQALFLTDFPAFRVGTGLAKWSRANMPLYDIPGKR